MGAVTTPGPKGAGEEAELQELGAKLERWKKVALQKPELTTAQLVPEQERRRRE